MSAKKEETQKYVEELYNLTRKDAIENYIRILRDNGKISFLDCFEFCNYI